MKRVCCRCWRGRWVEFSWGHGGEGGGKIVGLLTFVGEDDTGIVESRNGGVAVGEMIEEMKWCVADDGGAFFHKE